MRIAQFCRASTRHQKLRLISKPGLGTSLDPSPQRTGWSMNAIALTSTVGRQIPRLPGKPLAPLLRSAILRALALANDMSSPKTLALGHAGKSRAPAVAQRNTAGRSLHTGQKNWGARISNDSCEYASQIQVRAIPASADMCCRQ